MFRYFVAGTVSNVVKRCILCFLAVKVSNSEVHSGYGMSCDVTVVPGDCPPGPELARPTSLNGTIVEPHCDDDEDGNAARLMQLDFLPATWNGDDTAHAWAGKLSRPSLFKNDPLLLPPRCFHWERLP